MSFLLARWPALLGLLVAILAVLVGIDRDAVTITLGTASLCYLAAAALGRPAAAWWTIAAVGVLVVAGRLAGLDPPLSLGAVALVLVGVGAARRVRGATLVAEALNVVVFGGGAVLALLLGDRAGLAVVGALLVAHALWDVAHLRRRAVVAPSMAEFCVVLDVPLGLAALAVASS